ncbi:MAG: DUF2953 domain-containing protein [Oscillospiraceae bacterium]|nr:DUF2953 domain-containing protein [Oscillospiraceae bacterium]
MIVLKIIGWILLGIIALIVLVLCIKLGFRIEYSNENTSVILKWFFLNLPLYPKEKKDKKPKKKVEKTEKEEEKQDKPKKEKTGDSFLKVLYNAEGTDGIIAILKKIMSYTKSFFGGSLRAFIIDELFLDIRCTKSDAASTAIYYGEVCSAVFPLLGSLASKYRIKKYDVRVYPDYIARFSDASFALTLHVTPIRFIGVTLAYVFKLLFGVLAGLLVKIFGANKEKNSDRNDNNKTKNKEKSDIK